MTSVQPDTDRLWRAIDSITKPSSRPVVRDEAVAHLVELRDSGRLAVAVTSKQGTIPSLWEQAEEALFGGEQQIGGGSKPLRERSIADMDLMETMSDIRESIGWNLDGRKIREKRGTVPAQMRQLAAFIATNEPANVDLWIDKLERWARLLGVRLNALEHQPKPVYLRNMPCPTCKTRQVTVERDGDKVVVPAIVIDFREGYVRAAECQACGDAWFRGPDLEALAEVANPIGPFGEVVSA